MPKLSTVARVRIDPRLNGPVVSRSLSSTELIRSLVENNSGSSYSEIQKLVPELASGTINSALWRLSHKGDIQRKKLDGFYRYYAKNYHLSQTPPLLPTAPKPEPAVKPNSIKRLAQDYLWDNELPEATQVIKDFVKYVENHNA